MAPDLDPIPSSTGGVEVAPGVVLPEAVLRFSFSRSSGPGGQNVNKLSTKARLEVSLTEIQARIGATKRGWLEELAGPSRLTAAGDLVITSEESRSQQMNRRACLERLRQMLIEAMRPRAKRRRTRPTAGSRERRLHAKKQTGEIKRNRNSPQQD